MTRCVCICGWIFFLLYLLVLPYLNSWVQFMLIAESESMAAEGAVIYYVMLFALCLILFWRMLRRDFMELLDRLPENLGCVLAGLAFTEILYLLSGKLPFPVPDLIPMQYAAEYAMAPWATLALLLVLMPLVEEIMFRGLVFGSLRSVSAPLAYGVTVVCCALSQVWRYAIDLQDPRYLLLAVRHLPLSIACTWCYDRGGSVWACAVLHGLANGLLLLFILF